MDKNCKLVKFDGDHIIIESGPISVPPVVNSESIMVVNEGELPKGIYYYAITSMGVNGESGVCNVLQVKAPHAGNSIVLSWVPIQYITEYRVYRGTEYGKYDGYFTLFTRTGNFQDSGMEELNIARQHPPECNPFNDTSLNDRKIHRSAIKKTSSLFLGGDPHIIHLYLILKSGESVIIDLMKVMNQPSWSSSQKHGLLRALSEIGEFIDASKS